MIAFTRMDINDRAQYLPLAAVSFLIAENIQQIGY